MLPNFLVIGAIKSGTTSLHRYLRRHPQVFTSKRKEPEFFASGGKVGTWDRGLRWYEDLFAEAGDALAVGEASISYTQYPLYEGVPARIAQVLPDVRLVYLVRHPIDRMVSHFWMRIRNGRETEKSIDKALHTDSHYLDISRYAMQIEQYLEYFSLERILIVKSEDLRAEREATLGRIFGFLGVDPGLMPEVPRQEYGRGVDSRRKRRPIDATLRHVPGYKVLAKVSPESVKHLKRGLTTKQTVSRPTLSASRTQELEDTLRDDVRRLRDYMGEDFDGWGIG
jgi:sulfotransferase family protein